MKKEWRGFVTGFIAATLIFSTIVPVVAATVRQINATYKDIKITLDGAELIPKDVNGNVVEPFVSGGTTYLPIRAIANALDLDVDWDGATNTVVLAHKDAGTQNPPALPEYNGERHAMTAGEIFQTGGFIEVGNVEIMYNGKDFLVKNNRNDIVRITVTVVGVKADGTYQTLQSATFGGPDETKYQNDLAANGWAVKENTNMIWPGETLVASISVFDFGAFGEGYASADVDGDGYYDIVFTVHPQRDENSMQVSTNDPKSAAYKLKAD